MKINLATGARRTFGRSMDVIALVVLAGELFALVHLTEIHGSLVNTVRSGVVRIAVYAAVFVVCSRWGLTIWPRIRSAMAWMIWTVGFGILGAFFAICRSNEISAVDFPSFTVLFLSHTR